MLLHDLPRETIDQIIQLLSDDHHTLHACSLVGWLFLPSCRYAMFSTISVGYRQLGAFLDVIDSPLSTVAPALRGILFTQKPRCYGHFYRGQPVPVVSKRVMAMLENNISYIQLEGTPPRYLAGFWNFMAGLKGVREVGIESVMFEMAAIGISDVVGGWVCSLSELEDLFVVGSPSSSIRTAPLKWRIPVPLPSWAALVGEGAKRSGGGVRVSLDIGDWDQLGVVRWLMNQNTIPRVRTLRIGSSWRGFWDGGSPCDVQLLKDFVAKVGSDIENLNILLPENAETDTLQSLDLTGTSCTNLRTIRINGFQIGLSYQAQRILMLETIFEKMMDSVNGPSLQEIVEVIRHLAVEPPRAVTTYDRHPSFPVIT